MKNSLLKNFIAVGTVFMVIGCGGDNTFEKKDNGAKSGLPSSVEDAINKPASVLTQDLKDSIAYMYNEEGLAYDVYTNIYKVQAVKQLTNIATNSEIKHIDAVNELAIKYDLNMTTYDPTLEPYSNEGIGDGKYSIKHIQDLYDTLYAKGVKSKQDALEVGCMVEVVDIDDLDTYIAQAKEANASDVLDIFTFLINGSYTHYWAFNDGLENMGVAGGCCAVAPALGYDFCHDESEYPRK